MCENSIIGFIKDRRDFLEAKYVSLLDKDDPESCWKRNRYVIRILELDFLLEEIGFED